jgi:hypothetical protein
MARDGPRLRATAQRVRSIAGPVRSGVCEKLARNFHRPRTVWHGSGADAVGPSSPGSGGADGPRASGSSSDILVHGAGRPGRRPPGGGPPRQAPCRPATTPRDGSAPLRQPQRWSPPHAHGDEERTQSKQSEHRKKGSPARRDRGSSARARASAPSGRGGSRRRPRARTGQTGDRAGRPAGGHVAPRSRAGGPWWPRARGARPAGAGVADGIDRARRAGSAPSRPPGVPAAGDDRPRASRPGKGGGPVGTASESARPEPPPTPRARRPRQARRRRGAVILIANWRSVLKIMWRRLCHATRFGGCRDPGSPERDARWSNTSGP